MRQKLFMQLPLLTLLECWQELGMSRKLRIEYPGALYHVMNRGDHLPAPQRSRQAGREDIFKDDEDRQRFLSA